MKPYRGIFFDLDHTLWDYERNALETLQDLFNEYQLAAREVEFTKFHQQFNSVNAALWYQFDRGQITSEVIRQNRFKQVLEPFGIQDNDLIEAISANYLISCPKKPHLIPGTEATLDYLSSRYILTIITNGFEEIQQMKLVSGNLHRYFAHIITSQRAGHRKPAPEIFDYALQLNGFQPGEALMIGDNPVTDIQGALNAGLDAVYFNPAGQEELPGVRTISALSELPLFL